MSEANKHNIQVIHYPTQAPYTAATVSARVPHLEGSSCVPVVECWIGMVPWQQVPSR